MTKSKPKYTRILAVAPSTRGFGYAVHEGQDTLVDRGGKRASGDKNRECLAKVDELIDHWQPEVLVLEDSSGKGSRRAPRIQKLCKGIIALARNRKVSMKVFSRKTIRKVFFVDGQGTRHDVAKMVAEWFPEELGLLLPSKRRACDDGEDPRMDIFDAVALVMVHRLREANRTAYRIATEPVS